MRGGVVGVIVLVSAAGLAGCIDDPAGDGVPDATGDVIGQVLAAIQFEIDHDHGDPALHAASWNVDQVAYDGLNEGGGAWVYGEADVVGHYAFVATLAPKGGFVIVDIEDPTRPTMVGRYTAATTYAADIKVTHDLKYAVLGSQGTFNQNQWMPPQHLPPVDPSSVGINGFQLVSLKDLSKPVFVHFLPVEQNGVHMLDLHTIGGATYAFGAPGSGGHVTIARIMETPEGAVLKPEGKYYFPGATLPAGLGNAPNTAAIGPHDVTVYDDAIAGKPLMLVAAGTSGVQVVDVSNPMSPKLLGAWAEHEGRYVHTVMPAIVEGKRLVVATPETFKASEQQPLWVLDATDPGKIVTLGIWKLPGERLGYNKDYRFSTHNTNVRDGIIYLSHFHAGLWILDISTLEKARSPVVRGAFVPGESGNLGVGTGLGLEAAPLVWDAIPLESGHVLVADIPTGLYIVTDPTVKEDAPTMAAAPVE